ncbi:MAG TPA: polyphosphate polymerase domain-containing protein [Hydrogenophaga sp.]|nr:polyphosphate polymerase domain-containing protein [Hydrogenophaga sp.]
MALSSIFERFPRIGLDEMNVKAELLTRRDNKYLINAAQLADVLLALETRCDMLEIDGRHRFQYESVYLDTEDHHCFRDHNQNRRHRLKLRFRRYADSLQTYFEIKVKDRNNQTRKYRQRVDHGVLAGPALTPELRAFLDDKLQKHPHQLAKTAYGPTIQVGYERITLVSRQESIRVTLDNRLRFSQGSGIFHTGEHLWVMEVKSEKGRSWIDRLLVQQRIRPVPRCSKYCVGLSLVNEVARISRFTPTANLIRRMT